MARATNGVIGRAGAIPWRLKSDMALFRELTLGKPVIMGRRTWESLPRKPLAHRLNLVLSRDGAFTAPGALVCDTLAEAIEIGREQAAEDGACEVCVIGGAPVFEAAMPRAQRLYLTEVEVEADGDVLFPALDEAEWIERERRNYPASEGDEHAFVFRILERRG